MSPKGGHNHQSFTPSTYAESSRLLYSSKSPPRGASAFVIASSCALAGSPLWAPALLGALGYRAVSLSRLVAYPRAFIAKLWATMTRQHLAITEPSAEVESDLRAQRERDRASMRRRWGLFFLAAILAYLPVRRWKFFHQNPVWERLWYDLL